MEAKDSLAQIRASQTQEQLRRMKHSRSSLFGGLYEKRDIPYGEEKDKRRYGDFFSPCPEENMPVILEIHGGGLISCEKEVNTLHARALAHQGFHVLSMEYRLQPETDTGGQLADIYAALDFILKHADEYHFDTTRLFLSGDSAGGHLALLTALSAGHPDMRKFFHLPMPGLSICGLALSCPLHDLRFYINRTRYGAFLLPENALKDYLCCCSVEEMLEGTKLPPTFIVTTPGDTAYYPETLRLHQILDSRQVLHQYREYQPKFHPIRHVFNVLYPEWEESMEANEDIAAFLKKI